MTRMRDAGERLPYVNVCNVFDPEYEFDSAEKNEDFIRDLTDEVGFVLNDNKHLSREVTEERRGHGRQRIVGAGKW